jgi:hypothetical protein
MGFEVKAKTPDEATQMWFRVATLLMHKMGVDHLEISNEEIERHGRKNVAITIAFHAQKGIALNLVDIGDLKRSRLRKTLGGR